MAVLKASFAFSLLLAVQAGAADVLTLPGLESEGKKPAATARPGKYTGRYFIFSTLPDWQGPLAVEAGVKYVPPGGDASVTVRFIDKASPLYHEPAEFRRRLRERGSIADPGVLDIVQIGNRYGSRVRYRTHLYGGEFLFGKDRSIRYNEMIVVPVTAGAYQIHYEARLDDFDRFRPGYLFLLKSLTLPPADRYKPEEYYAQHSRLLRPLIEERVDKDAAAHRDRNDWYGQPYRFLAAAGLPLGTKVGGNSLGGGRVILLGGLREISEILSVGGALNHTSYSGASAVGLDLVVRTNLTKQKPVTPYLAFTGGVEQFKLGGLSSTGTVYSFGAGAAARWRPNLDATLELRYRNSDLDGKTVSGTVHSPQLLAGLNYYFGK